METQYLQKAISENKDLELLCREWEKRVESYRENEHILKLHLSDEKAKRLQFEQDTNLKIKELKRELTAKDQENNLLRTKINNLEVNPEDENIRLDAKANEKSREIISSLRNEVKELENQIMVKQESAEKKINELHSELTSKENEYTRKKETMQRRINDLKFERDRATNELTDQQALNQEQELNRRKEHAKLSAEVEALRILLKSSDDNLQVAEMHLQDLVIKNTLTEESLKQENKIQSMTNLSLENRITVLTKEVNHLKIELANELRLRSSLEVMLNDRNKQLEEITKNTESTNLDETNELSEQLNDQKVTISKLESELASTETLLKQITKNEKRLNLELEEALRKLETQAGEIESNKEKSQMNVKKLELETESLASELKATEALLRAMELDFHKEQLTNSSISTQLEELKKTIEALTLQNFEEKEARSKLELKINTLEGSSSVSKLKAQNIKLKEKLNEANKQLVSLLQQKASRWVTQDPVGLPDEYLNGNTNF